MFLKMGFINGNLFTALQQGLTDSALLDFFCRNSNKVENFDHYGRGCLHHSFIWCHFGVCVQTSEKCLYALEYLRKSVLVRANGLSCLRIVRITIDRTKVLRRVHTERRTPNPIKITFAGENTCRTNMRGYISDKFCSEAYRADTFSECLREGMKDVHSWVEPLRVVGLRLIELLDKLLKHGENAASRITSFKPVGERVGEKIVPCAFFVRFQGVVEDQLEVGR